MDNEIRYRFPGIQNKTRANNPQVGKAFLYIHPGSGQKIFNLVIKLTDNLEPNYSAIIESLKDMKRQCIENDIEKIVLPCLETEKIEWPKVRALIRDIFSDTQIDITVKKN